MLKPVIETNGDKCKTCYACIRNCPVKAVRMVDGKASIIQERCISCGNCLKVCSQNAKEVEESVNAVETVFQSGHGSVALVAPSYPGVIKVDRELFIGALKSLGFNYVWEVAIGADAVVEAYKRIDFSSKLCISTPCPAIVNLVEMHYPELVPSLAPVMSPALATAKLARNAYRDPDMKLVFIGPCICKKQEIKREEARGLIDIAMSFDELWQLFSRRGIDLEKASPAHPDNPCASLGYTIPLSGGLLNALRLSGNLLDQQFIVAEGPEDCIEVISSVAAGEVDVKFLDLLFCKGCVDGPKIASEKGLSRRKADVMDFYLSIPEEKKREADEFISSFSVDLSSSFVDRSTSLPQPTEEDIKKILARTGKYTPEDELNCGACGYPSCREKAIAVFQGIAEVEMCLPYLITRKTELLNDIEKCLLEERKLNRENKAIIECSYDGIVVTDGQGNILKVNPALEQLLHMSAAELVGRNVADLEREKIIYPSATLLSLKQKKPVTFLQKLKSGKEVLATGNPVLNEKGEVTEVIVNIRDYNELQRMKEQLEKGLGQICSQWDEDVDSQLVAHSPVFIELLGMARKVAGVDSTVLILGESGTGKEVITRYIHQLSPRKDGPFVKINCGAIPENLMESELFGYETGAFTGAKRQGKPGLLEIAHGGTVFLDEVGDLPLSQQVKLLRVLQEKKIIRVGGTAPIDIDIRVIAATNRELAEMVKQGEFRADLYYRLSVVPLKVPPLRERKEDIIPLANYFLARFNKKYSTNRMLSERLKEILLEYHWPGNVRELENLVERLVVTARGSIIQPEDLPPAFTAGENIDKGVEVKGILPLKKALEEVEKQLLLQAKERYNSTYKMAEVLEVNQSTIVRKLKKYTGT